MPAKRRNSKVTVTLPDRVDLAEAADVRDRVIEAIASVKGLKTAQLVLKGGAATDHVAHQIAVAAERSATAVGVGFTREGVAT